MPVPERPPVVSESERRAAFARRVNAYPDDAQDLVSGVSSMMMESDIAAIFRTSPKDIRFLKNQLLATGIDRSELPVVLDYFGLPDPDKATLEDRK